MIHDIIAHPANEREQTLVDYIRLLESDALAKLPHRVLEGSGLPRKAVRRIEGRNMALILARALDVTAHLGNVGIDTVALVNDVQMLSKALDAANVWLVDREY